MAAIIQGTEHQSIEKDLDSGVTDVQTITTKSGVALTVNRRFHEGATEVSIQTANYRNCVLHWGLRRDAHGKWQMPPRSTWPEGTRSFDQSAVQTPFSPENGTGRILIRLSRDSGFSQLVFALYFTGTDRWDNNSGRNYEIVIPGGSSTEGGLLSPLERIRQETQQARTCYEHVYRLENDRELAAVVTMERGHYRVTLATDLSGPLLLHWGVAVHSLHEWLLPPASILPRGTSVVQGGAAETPFTELDGYLRLDLDISEGEAPLSVLFVLRQPDTNRWLKNRGQDFSIPITGPAQGVPSIEDPHLAGLANEIIEKEMSRNSWTLMHRFNLCYDLLDRPPHGAEAQALIFVWLRFSALRQLDWQRNYNTQPRELAHSLDRLSLKLADLHAQHPAEGEFLRLTMTTLGRGSEGQRVRDEVLNIMHRHHIKEVSGHFMEEWHQKLHNNTTPDDVAICEAYIEFLRSNGSLERFYGRLKEAGVTKERLESFERPIRSHPDFIPHLKDALIHDFEHFLGILKAVHAGTDLGTAMHAARYLFDGEMHGLMDFIWAHRYNRQVSAGTLAGKITEARRRLSNRIPQRGNGVRDLLFLDLALEDFLRVVVERSIQFISREDELVELVDLVIENILFSRADQEIAHCQNHWKRIKNTGRDGTGWFLRAKAALDRMEQALSGFTDRYHRVLQPKAELLGRAFRAEPWTVTLFSEEVIRGRLEFVLAILLRRLDPILRGSANLGNWQVISPGRGEGYIESVPALGSIQGREYSKPTVIIADKVVGDEEIPQGVTAVITPDTTDVVSHVAIRARNGRLLFVTCHDPDMIERLKSLEGRWCKVNVDGSNDVVIEEGSEQGQMELRRVVSDRVRPPRPVFTGYVVSAKDFQEENVGGKSRHLKELRGRLPEWIHVPLSVALPFGVFEHVLASEENKDGSARYQELTGSLSPDGGGKSSEVLDSASRFPASRLPALDEDGKWRETLDELRKTIQTLEAPPGLLSSLEGVMRESGLPLPENWEVAWASIKRVWGSKWNERAYLSRRANGIRDEDLFMAVLIQQVVEADYAYVIHTVNPASGDTDEIYAEVVPGLGETLVGNYPGRAFSFTCKKGKDEPQILTFPSKSVGLYGSGLIFRSDSNGEDLIGYAGAGLYDSFMLPPPGRVTLDYADESLVWDERFQKDLMTTISRIGCIVEEVLALPQDIEGAFSKGQYYVVQTRPQVGIKGERC